MTEIVNSVNKVSDIVAEIAAASSEQSTGIDQINKAIAQMDEMTQQNAAMVEEAVSASKSVNEQAEGLNELMEFFTVETAGKRSATRKSASDSERRAQTKRPWTKPAVAKSTVAASATSVPLQKVASAGTGAADEDWQEF